MNYFIVSEDKLRELLYATYKLDMLECNGVDNWIGYMDNYAEYIADELDITIDEVVDGDLGIEEIVEQELKNNFKEVSADDIA